MKPVLGNMDTKIPEAVVTPCESECKSEKSSTRPKWIVVIVTIVVGMVILTSGIIVAVYLGVTMTRTTYKDAYVTFNTDKGQSVVEKITDVSDNEVKVDVPNGMKVIYDYKYGIAVYRMKAKDSTTEGPCFAIYMNITPAATHPHVNTSLEGTEVNLVEQSHSPPRSYKATNRTLPLSHLSTAAQDMCHGTPVYWLEEVKDGPAGRSRRGAYSGSDSVTCSYWYKEFIGCIPLTDDFTLWYCEDIDYYYCSDDSVEYVIVGYLYGIL